MPSQADEEYFSSARSRLLRDHDPSEGKERFQRHLRLQSHNDRYHHMLVNYLTGMMLRVRLQTMRRKLWDEHCVITLAKFAAKLKVLVNDLPKYVSFCLAKTEAARFRKSQKYGQTRRGPDRYYSSDDEHASKNEFRLRRRKKPSDPISSRIGAEMRYFIVMKTFHLGISRLLESSLENLSSNKDTEMSANVFDTTALMYEDYITTRHQYLCSQRDGTIRAATDRRVIASTGAAFQVYLDAWSSLNDETAATTPMPDHWTRLCWK
jgi:hypothetical protein